MRRVAGAVEGDGAGVGQRRDEMAGGVGAVEMAVGAVDDEGRLPDRGQQRPEILLDQRFPQRADGGRIVGGEGRSGAVGLGAGRRRRSPGRRRRRRPGNRRGSPGCAPRRSRATGRGPSPSSFSTRGVMSTTTAPANLPRGRPGQHAPEHGRAERPADPDRALQLRAPGQPGHVLGEQADGGRHRPGRRPAVAAQVDGDRPGRRRRARAAARRSRQFAISPCRSTSGRPSPSSE